MRSLLLAVLAAYLIAAIHSILAFINKRRSVQRVAEWSTIVGFILHTVALGADWFIDGHYPLFSLREALSFLAWALVPVYGAVLYRYRAQAVGAFTMPLISVLTFISLLIALVRAKRRRRFRRHGFSRSTLPSCLRLRRVLRGVHGERDVPAPGT